MKRTVFMLAMASLVGVLPATAQAAKPAATAKPATATTAAAQSTTTKSKAAAPAKPAAVKPHTMDGEFVSYDAQAKAITVKDKAGASSTSAVEGKAIAEAAALKSGDHVMLTVNDKTVTAIKVTKSGKAKAKA